MPATVALVVVALVVPGERDHEPRSREWSTAGAERSWRWASGTAGPIAITSGWGAGRARPRLTAVQLPPGDPRLPAVEALTRALDMRIFDDGAISLDACLRDFQEVGIVGR